MELFYPVDTAISARDGAIYPDLDDGRYHHYTDSVMSPRLPTAEIAELQSQMNVNLSDGCDDWFDDEYVSPDMHIVDEDEFFDRFCN